MLLVLETPTIIQKNQNTNNQTIKQSNRQTIKQSNNQTIKQSSRQAVKQSNNQIGKQAATQLLQCLRGGANGVLSGGWGHLVYLRFFPSAVFTRNTARGPSTQAIVGVHGFREG